MKTHLSISRLLTAATATLALAAVPLLTSCLHDDDEKFDTPAALRSEQAVAADRQLLTTAANGWRLYYFTGEGYSGRGYTYFLRFQGDRVEVGSEARPTLTATSHYDVIADQGPVLTINTYNEVMHELSEPGADHIDGDQADYEFIIQRTTPDSVFLKGRKWGNKMLMVRMPDDQSWQQYTEAVARFEHQLLRTYTVTVDGQEQGIVYFNTDTRQATVTKPGGETFKTAFCTTPDGFYTAQPVGDANGFSALPQSLSLAATDAAHHVRLEERITPEYLYTLLGNSAVGLPNHDASRTISHDIVARFNFTSNDPWIQVSKSGTSLTVTADDNAAGYIRRGSITVEVDGETDVMQVTQYDYERDVLGHYYMMYTDRDGDFQIEPANLTEGGDGCLLLDYTFYYNGTPVPLTIPFDFDADRCTLTLRSGQFMGRFSSYGLYSLFADRNLTSWTAASTDYSYVGNYDYDDGDLYVSFSGVFGTTDMAIGELVIMAASGDALTTSSMAGYIGMLFDPVMLKADDESWVDPDPDDDSDFTFHRNYSKIQRR